MKKDHRTRAQACAQRYYLQALEVVYEVLGKDDPELILTVGLQAGVGGMIQLIGMTKSLPPLPQ